MAADVNRFVGDKRVRLVLKGVSASVTVVLMLALTASAASWLLIRDELNAVSRIVKRSSGPMPALASAALTAAEDPLFLAAPPLLPNVRCLRPRVVCCGGGVVVSEVLARYTTRPKRSARWHLETKLLGLAISRMYAPEELLAAYTNEVYLGTRNGHDIRGAEAAANAYFGKRASQLTPAEAALLGAIVRAPNVFISDRDGVLKRRNIVLRRMRDARTIDDEVYGRAVVEPLRMKSGA